MHVKLVHRLTLRRRIEVAREHARRELTTPAREDHDLVRGHVGRGSAGERDKNVPPPHKAWQRRLYPNHVLFRQKSSTLFTFIVHVHVKFNREKQAYLRQARRSRGVPLDPNS